jgi:hypothetical protein
MEGACTWEEATRRASSSLDPDSAVEEVWQEARVLRCVPIERTMVGSSDSDAPHDCTISRNPPSAFRATMMALQ